MQQSYTSVAPSSAFHSIMLPDLLWFAAAWERLCRDWPSASVLSWLIMLLLCWRRCKAKYLLLPTPMLSQSPDSRRGMLMQSKVGSLHAKKLHHVPMANKPQGTLAHQLKAIVSHRFSLSPCLDSNQASRKHLHHQHQHQAQQPRASPQILLHRPLQCRLRSPQATASPGSMPAEVRSRLAHQDICDSQYPHLLLQQQQPLMLSMLWLKTIRRTVVPACH